MPSAVVKSFAKKAGIDIDEAEKRYQEALDIAAEEEFPGAKAVLKRARAASGDEKTEIYKELSDDFWAYSMGIYKKMMSVDESIWSDFIADMLIEGLPSTIATLVEMTTSASIANRPIPLPIRDPEEPEDDIEFVPFSRWDPQRGMVYVGHRKKGNK
jgi:hypothetical protein